MKRREYDINVVINRRRITKVIIDPHFEKNHAASINDEIILAILARTGSN